ncbi:MAG: site-specific integrase [Microbacterium sp.]
MALARIRDADGRLRRVTGAARTDSAARASLKQRLLERPAFGTGGLLDLTSSFRDLAELWLEDLALQKLSEGTKDNYRDDLRLHVLPQFEHFTLGEITTGRVEWFLRSEAAVSFSRAKHSRTMLNLLFGFALRHDAIQRNPVQGTSPLRRPKGEPHALTVDQITAIRDSARRWRTGPDVKGPKPDGQVRDIIEVLLGTALRIGGRSPGVRCRRRSQRDDDLTRENLLIALGDPSHSLSLDAIKSTTADVYSRVLGGVGEYLSVLAEGELTIVEPTAFAAILEEVAETDESALQVVVERSATDCVVTALADVESTTWKALAGHGRFPVTFANVYAYIAEYGLDDLLARMLEAGGEIETPAGADEAPKLEVALTILRDADRLPSAKLRAELVDSLGLTTQIDIASIPREAGEFVGWLIAKDVIRDDAATFSVIGANDIDGLAFAISKSANFASFMTTAEVTPARVGALTVHARVPEAVKDTILARFTDFTVGTSRTGLSLIARYAVDNNRRLAFDEVARLAREGVDAELIVPLLGSYLPSVGLAELAPVLISLGGEFAKLSAPNGRHPRVPLTSANRALVDRLEALEIANSSTEADGEIKVNMKQG